MNYKHQTGSIKSDAISLNKLKNSELSSPSQATFNKKLTKDASNDTRDTWWKNPERAPSEFQQMLKDVQKRIEKSGFEVKIGADIQQLRRKLKIPDFDDSFQFVQSRDYMQDNKKFVGALDEVRNFHKKASRKQMHSLQPHQQQKPTVKEVLNTSSYANNPKYSKALGIETETSARELIQKADKASPIEREKEHLQMHINKIKNIILNNPYKQHRGKELQDIVKKQSQSVLEAGYEHTKVQVKQPFKSPAIMTKRSADEGSENYADDYFHDYEKSNNENDQEQTFALQKEIKNEYKRMMQQYDVQPSQYSMVEAQSGANILLGRNSFYKSGNSGEMPIVNQIGLVGGKERMQLVKEEQKIFSGSALVQSPQQVVIDKYEMNLFPKDHMEKNPIIKLSKTSMKQQHLSPDTINFPGAKSMRKLQQQSYDLLQNSEIKNKKHKWNTSLKNDGSGGVSLAEQNFQLLPFLPGGGAKPVMKKEGLPEQILDYLNQKRTQFGEQPIAALKKE
ncbi:hypothetical protein FGO68_gene5169 [Halteria grandinella]|uniref:Uncharacterized protein n=1 Tax=Halteria grandinella TaxID=5974 RepID=A0A8J8T7Y3_HALGN|nr:hypothetical protein FGO68_gene5169 [Halteria grandinella]